MAQAQLKLGLHFTWINISDIELFWNIFCWVDFVKLILLGESGWVDLIQWMGSTDFVCYIWFGKPNTMLDFVGP